MGSPPPDLSSLVAALARGLAGAGIPFMLIGGQAVLVHGRPRLTEDIDVTLGVGSDRLTGVLGACGTIGLAPLPAEVERFVQDTFVLPCRDPGSGLRVDLIFSNTPYERQAIERADRIPIGGEDVPVATAEDLILHKLFAGRARDIEDAESVVRRKQGALDWDYLVRWAREFAAVPGREQLPAQVERLRGHR